MYNAWARNQKGFTIVELLIVIVIIGILAAIIIVSYNGIQTRARVAALSSDLEGVYKKLTLYQLDNATYPPDLATGGVTASSGNTFQYSYNNAVSPQTFCVTGTNGSTSYKISDTGGAAQSGGCPGHGVGGVSANTNLSVNPSFESVTTQHNLYNGATISRQAVGDAASGSYVGRIMRGTAGSGLLAMIYPIAWGANEPVSARFKVRLAPGSTAGRTIVTNVAGYNTGSGVGSATGCSTTPAGALSTTTWSEVVIQGCTTPNVTMNSIGIQITPGQSWLATDGIEIDAEMVVKASTVPAFADGNSPNWVWNGTVNNSTSTGP